MKELYNFFYKNSLNNKGQRFFPILVDKFFFNCKHNNKKLQRVEKKLTIVFQGEFTIIDLQFYFMNKSLLVIC
jgi:hypothetical protein